MPEGVDVSNVRKTLDILRETPADASAASDKVLGAIYSYLLNVSSSSDGITHWFCSRADATTVDAATFLIRLMAYNSSQVVEWKKRLHKCLTSCAFCAQGLEVAKVTSQNTFLAAFSQEILVAFFLEFDRWEVKEVLEDLSSITTTGETSSRSLPTGTLYRIMSNWAIFREPQVLSYLQTHVPSDVMDDWPENPIPAGVLVLLFSANPELRSWAISRASRSRIIEPALFTGSYAKSIDLIVWVLKAAYNEPSSDLNPSARNSLTECLQFTKLADIWTVFPILLRLVPPEWFKSNSGLPLELKRNILKHLRDGEPYFPDVFKCFILTIKRLGKDVWAGEGPEYPLNIFEAIQNNPVYNMQLGCPTSEPGITNLAWIQEYLSTIRGYDNYESILEAVLNRLFEDVQTTRLDKVRSTLALFLTRTIHKELQRCRIDNLPTLTTSLLRITEIHFGILLSLAYGQEQSDKDLENARISAQNLVEDILSADVGSLTSSVTGLCRILHQKRRQTTCEQLPVLAFRESTWKAFYCSNQTPGAIASFVSIVSKVAHLDPLRNTVFTEKWDFPAGDRVVKGVNHAITILQNGLSNSITSFADYSVSNNAIDTLRRPGVGKAVMLLLLSPAQDFHSAAKTLVGLAFDVDGRMECFRSLLENLPDEAMDGVLEFLTTFHSYASTMPEASNLSAALVRCFADILDVLCANPDGLLHNPYFLRPKDPSGPASRMLKFWNSLTKSLCIIYSRASMWAQYIDTPDMVLWMRDALILARDTLKQWRVIENASNAMGDSSKSAKKGELSTSGRQMVEALQDFLPELIKWLRLTDEELLHQSFSLLQSLFDLMKETHVRPSDLALEKLGKHVEGALGMDSSTRVQKTRLDQGRLLQLSEVLAFFNEDARNSDDDVTILSHTIVSKKKPTAEKPVTKSGADTRNYILGKEHSSKTVHRPSQPTLSFVPSRPSGSSGSKFFSDADQKKLESSTTIPAFRKSGVILPTGTTRKIIDHRRPLKKSEPKNEALSLSAHSSEESSSSSSESDEDIGLGADAFKKSPKLKSPKKPKPVERRQIKTLDIPLRSNPAQDKFLRNKQAHYNAMRMRPDISDLHRVILSWDYNHDGPSPPGKAGKPVSIPARFENYSHYFRIFRPLLLLECWAQLQQSKEEKQDSYQCKVDSRQYVDDWLDIDITISDSVRKDWYLAETDVVLLRHSGRDKCLMGKVKSYRPLPSGISAVIRCYIQEGAGDPGLQITTSWQISKILSLSTLHREYGALVSLQYNDICGFILQPSLPVPPAVDKKDVKETMENYKLNEPQATAILKAMKKQGFSLIQGPPGTGKTSTICGLIARFMSQRPRSAVPIVVGKVAPSMNSSRNSTGQPLEPSARILVCAPSNAAIDELAQRIKDGFVGPQRKSNPLNIVRVGADQAISSTVRDISLDYLVDQKLDATPKPFNEIGNEIRSIRQELESIKQDRLVKVAELTTLPENTSRKMTLENEVKVLNSRRQSLINKLDSQKDKQKSDSRTLDTLRRNTRREIVTQADVICSTLSGAGHDILENLDFDMIIIDEAAQAIELSSLIPLKYSCSRCVMVGDPQQLPPTVLSQEASRFGYNQSLFVRLQQNQRDATHLLSIQYRMHPDISELPSKIFYSGKLLDGPNMDEKTKQPWHTHAKFGTYRFLNVSWGIEESNGHSIKNSAECNVAIELYNRLRRDFATTDFNLRIGVVSMYKAQITTLRKLFVERFGNEILSKIVFNTVDGFQGQEKDIIILSCVRAGPGLQNVGFLSDIRRMNVALTRAKSSLFVLGHTPTLERSDETWRKIIQDARARSALVNIDRNYFARAISPADGKGTAAKKAPRKETQVLSLPPDLSTPWELKASIERTRLAPKTVVPNDTDRTQIASSSSNDPVTLLVAKSPLNDDQIHITHSSTPDPSQGKKIAAAPNFSSNLGPHPTNMHTTTTGASSSSHLESARGTKRPPEPNEPRIATASNPPPRKKVKQPQTMFIPKKRT